MSKLYAFILLILAFANCKGPSKINDASPEAIPADMLGDFKDDYNISYTITEKEWIQHPDARYHLISYNEKEQYFVARNDEKNPSEAGLYSRIDVMYFQNMGPFHWGFCLTAYKAKTAEEAIATAAADRNNPKKGCGGFPFSRMKRY